MKPITWLWALLMLYVVAILASGYCMWKTTAVDLVPTVVEELR